MSRKGEVEYDNKEKNQCEAAPFSFANFIFNLGVKSGMPRYTAFVGLLQAGILCVPESVWTWLGIDAQKILLISPAFIQYYIINSSFQNAMSVFWLLSPFTLVICTALYTIHINGCGYQAYLCRRSARLKKMGKTNDYSLIVGMLVSVVLYAWCTAIYLVEPAILGGFTPPNNRYAMLIIHAGSLGLFLPGALAVLITEIRANCTAH